MQNAPQVDEYTVLVREARGLELITPPPYPGNSTILSLTISSLPQCMSYTVFVTASNTALESTSASTLLCELYYSCIIVGTLDAG